MEPDMGRSPEAEDAFALGLYLAQLLVEAAAQRDGLTGKLDVFLARVGGDEPRLVRSKSWV